MKRFLKLPIINQLQNHLVDYPTPSNISYWWGLGSLAGIMLVSQILTGVLLSMHYVANTELAFSSVEHIMRDVNSGWLLRYLHSNGASFFFLVVYIHIARGFYYRSYQHNPLLWISGVIIFVLMMATAFIGYVLPWGQMSFWGATVITNLVTAIPGIGEHIAHWLWGGFAVDNPTLNRFFSLHYLVPFLIVGIVLVHLVLLHHKGSSNPLGISTIQDKISFHPYFSLKDVVGLFVLLFVFLFFVFYYPNTLGHSDNYITANSLVTPLHIVPEWYFLPFYAILRACPNKIGGIVSMGGAIIIWVALIWLDQSPLVNPKTRPWFQVAFFIWAACFIFLGWLGTQPAEEPYVTYSKIASFIYFLYFLVVLPLIAKLEKAVFFKNSNISI